MSSPRIVAVGTAVSKRFPVNRWPEEVKYGATVTGAKWAAILLRSSESPVLIAFDWERNDGVDGSSRSFVPDEVAVVLVMNRGSFSLSECGNLPS